MLAFFGLFNVYALRVNLSVAIIPMAEHFGWNSKQNGLVLSSFYYGYLLTQIIGGVWAKKIGGNVVRILGCMTLYCTFYINNLLSVVRRWHFRNSPYNSNNTCSSVLVYLCNGRSTNNHWLV